MTYTEPCVDDKYFTNRKFTVDEKDVYTRIEHRFFVNPQTRTQEAIERIITFKVYDVDPEYGTNIEQYENHRLNFSGYWTDKKDFESYFRL